MKGEDKDQRGPSASTPKDGVEGARGGDNLSHASRNASEGAALLIGKEPGTSTAEGGAEGERWEGWGGRRGGLGITPGLVRRAFPAGNRNSENQWLT